MMYSYTIGGGNKKDTAIWFKAQIPGTQIGQNICTGKRSRMHGLDAIQEAIVELDIILVVSQPH